MDGEKTVRIHGLGTFRFRRAIELIESMSAHADSQEILRWLSRFSSATSSDLHRPRRAGGHGSAASNQVQTKLGWATKMPEHRQRVEL